MVSRTNPTRPWCRSRSLLAFCGGFCVWTPGVLACSGDVFASRGQRCCLVGEPGGVPASAHWKFEGIVGSGWSLWWRPQGSCWPRTFLCQIHPLRVLQASRQFVRPGVGPLRSDDLTLRCPPVAPDAADSDQQPRGGGAPGTWKPVLP